MVKVRVWLPFENAVPYTIDVDKADVESVKKAMRKKDPSDWDYDPDFYENLGSHYSHFVDKIDKDDIEVL